MRSTEHSQLAGTLVVLALTLLTPACEVTPDPADERAPTITLQEIARTRYTVFESTDPGAAFEEVVCSDDRALWGTFYEVESFPIQVAVTGADGDGIEWLRLVAEGAVITDAGPEVTVSRLTAGGIESLSARQSWAGQPPVTTRFFSVSVAPEPGESTVRLEGGGRDFSGNTTYTLLIHVGTNEGLCEAFG